MNAPIEQNPEVPANNDAEMQEYMQLMQGPVLSNETAPVVEGNDAYYIGQFALINA